MMRRSSKTIAKSFFTQLSSGEFKEPGRSQPIQLLRNRLIETGKEIIKPAPMVKLNWTISAWNAYRAGISLYKLSRLVETVPYFRPDPFGKSA